MFASRLMSGVLPSFAFPRLFAAALDGGGDCGLPGRARRCRQVPARAASLLLVLLALVAALDPSGAQAAQPSTIVSLTFDDSLSSQTIAGDILRENGLHGTFYVISNGIDHPSFLTSAQLDQIAADGNEIGGHTLDHVDLTAVGATEARRQICDDRSALISRGFHPKSFAYPYGAYNSTVAGLVQDCGYETGRTVFNLQGSGCTDCAYAETIPPADPYELRSVGSMDDSTTLADMKGFITQVEQHGGGWTNLAFHRICDLCDTYSTPETTFRAFVSWLAARASSGTVVRTISEAMSLSTGADTSPPSVSVTAPAGGATVSGSVSVSASAADDVGVAGVQFRLDGASLGAEDTSAPYGVSWDTSAVGNGAHVLTAVARDAAGNTTTSTSVSVTVSNTGGPPGAGLVAAYGFNEAVGSTVGDASGSGNVGTVQNATRSASGRFGGALSFNGSNASVLVPDAASLRLTAGMSLEAWVNPTVVTNWRTVILKEAPGTLSYALYAGTSSNAGPDGELVIGSAAPVATSSTRLTLNTWSHLALTYNGSTLRLYVNGAQVGSVAATGSIMTSSGALRIGGNSIWGEWFSGLIDEVRIYNRALSTSEIQTDMTTPISAPAADTSPPSVSVTAPAGGATVSGSVSVSASAADDVGVAGVQFRLDGASLGAEDTSAPYGVSWDTSAVGNGAHVLTAVARDAAGNTTTSTSVSVTVSNTGADTSPPSVSVTAPAGGATVSGSVSVSASAADDVGVAGVQFRLDGASLGAEDTSAPYGVSWDTSAVGNGAHVLTAVARDAAGNTTTSTSVSVTVSNTGGPPGAGLVAAYGFNEAVGSTVGDASGSGNVGTVQNATRSASGRFGGALSFNGSNASVLVPDAASLRLTAGMSLEAWVNPTVVTNWRTVILKEAPGTLSYALYAGTSSNAGPDGELVIGSAAPVATSSTRLTLNTWSHLALTYNGSTLRLYVNGAQVGSVAATGSIMTSSGALRIGGNSIWGEWFSGLIDEVRIYNRALSTSEIQTDMTTPIS